MIAAIFSLFPGIYVAMGVLFIVAPNFVDAADAKDFPAFMGWIFTGIGALFMLMGWLLTALILLTGRFLSKRRRYTFCMVVAGIECLFMPFGTVLGVFTLVVLSRQTVRAAFEKTTSPVEGGSPTTPSRP